MSALSFVPRPAKPRLTEIVRLRLSLEDAERLKLLAERNRRTLSNQVFVAVLEMLDKEAPRGGA